MSNESAIQLISLSPVPMSGAGTSRPGPMKFFLASSTVNLLVIFSSSDCCRERKILIKKKHNTSTYKADQICLAEPKISEKNVDSNSHFVKGVYNI